MDNTEQQPNRNPDETEFLQPPPPKQHSTTPLNNNNNISQPLFQPHGQHQTTTESKPQRNGIFTTSAPKNNIQQQQHSPQPLSTPQMTLGNIHMQQTQSMSVSSAQLLQPQHQQQQQQPQQQQQTAPPPSYNPHAAPDFSLEFLDNLTGGDAGAFTEQELLSSFDSDSGFNLQDIL